MKKTIKTLLVVTVILSICGCQNKEDVTEIDYDKYLFDTAYVHEISVTLSDEDFADLLSNPTDKTKYSADITIDGETLKDVSFATKGNSSLMFTAAEEGNIHFPFRINFGKNIKGQTYHGLDKLSLNNLYDDATGMKDYLGYELFRQIGVKAPLISYTLLRVNGTDFGLYAAAEDIDKGFRDRNQLNGAALYKPESEGLSLTEEDVEAISNGEAVPMGESHGSSLQYTDDAIESYPDIFNNKETSEDEEEDARVIAALKALDENRDLPQYLDCEEIIKYFAAQVFLLNYDSYIGPMLHNYYLCLHDDRLSILPWDYNLAFATMTLLLPKEDLSDPTRIINSGIDTPLHMASEDERPLWQWIITDDEYRKQYHDAYEDSLAYFESGSFSKEANRLKEMLEPYVREGIFPYSAEQFESGYEALMEYCQIRSASIRKQLNGELSADTAKQDPAARIDASHLNLKAMNGE